MVDDRRQLKNGRFYMTDNRWEMIDVNYKMVDFI